MEWWWYFLKGILLEYNVDGHMQGMVIQLMQMQILDGLKKI